MPKYGMSQTIPINEIVPSPFQVRKRYGKILQLAKNIEKQGLLQPILVRPVAGKYEIVHGHRRWQAIIGLGWKYIQSFVKELTDTEAILIQGSENLQRKNYDPIEEGTLYKNYKNFMLKEKNLKVSLKEIGDAFNTTPSNVRAKICFLDLPLTIQQKIIDGKISSRNAQALITLTKEPLSLPSERATTGEFESGEPQKGRTDKFYVEIEKVAREIEKGSKGGLRTRKGIQDTVKAIQEGKSVEKALEHAKLTESIEIAKKEAEKGKSPDEIIQGILDSQQDPNIVLDATVKLNIEITRKLLSSGTLKCPHCGENHLLWKCCQKEI